MNHGKIAKNEDALSLVDRLNSRLARLMGKKDPRQPLKPNLPGNFKFSLIISVMVISLWLLTGVYYVQDKSFGLVLQQGRITQVLSGLHIGVTWPYPFADVVILDSSGSNLAIGKNSDGKRYTVLSADNQVLTLNAEVSYQINAPERYFITYYQGNENQDQHVTWLIMTIIQDYILHHESNWLLQNSMIVSSNEIRQLSDKVLASYGLKLNKFSLSSISLVLAESAAMGNPSQPVANPLAANLLSQAKQFAGAKQQQTESIVSQVKRLLPQYHANQSAISQLIYYKMLSSIPTESASKLSNTFPLLNLTLSELEQLEVNPQLVNRELSNNAAVRLVDRSANRQRQFKDR